MSFDDHDENFQTLNNRNFSKQVLSRLESKQETLIIPSFQYNSDQEEPKPKTEAKQSSKKVQSSFDNYKRLSFSLYSVLMESAQTQSREMNSYFNFAINTAIFDHHRTEFSTSSRHHAGTSFHLQDPQATSEYPILLLRSTDSDSSQKTDSPQLLSNAVTIWSAFNKLQGTVSLVDVRACQLNIKVLANLVTSAYSCKNLLQHGQKRHLVKQLLG